MGNWDKASGKDRKKMWNDFKDRHNEISLLFDRSKIADYLETPSMIYSWIKSGNYLTNNAHCTEDQISSSLWIILQFWCLFQKQLKRLFWLKI